MFGKPSVSCANLLRGIAVVLTLSVTLVAAAPKGWFLAGSKPSAYETGMDPAAVYNDHPSAYLKSATSDLCQNGTAKDDCNAFATLMQSFGAEQYQGKRVRLTAFVKTESVDNWAGMWMRVDKGSKIGVAMDNMQDRPIRGTSGWRNYEVVLDVPADATGISFGILLAGHGEVWLNAVKFDVVGSDVDPTGQQASHAPANLGFEN